MAESNVLTAVFDVFTAVGDWFATAVESLIPMFYANGELTFIGVMSVAGLGVSIILLILNLIGDYLRFGR